MDASPGIYMVAGAIGEGYPHPWMIRRQYSRSRVLQPRSLILIMLQQPYIFPQNLTKLSLAEVLIRAIH